MAIGSGDFGELLDPGLKQIYGLDYNQYREEYTMIYGIENSMKNKEESLSVSGFGLVPEKQKGESVSYETTDENWKGTIIHVTYGLGFVVERELWEDDQYGIIKRLPRALARSVRHTIETIAANVLNNAFDGTNYADGPDGLELCSTAHLLGGGGTYKNEPTNAADLDSTSLEQALIDIADFVDDKNLLLSAMAKRLVVAPENMWTASKLLGSDKVPEDANNAKNPGKEIMPYSVNHFLTDPDAWFILTDIPDSLVFYWRRRPEFTRDNDFDSENAKWKTTMRFSVGWNDPRGIYGSPGV